MRRNTAPCIAYGIFRIMAENPDAVIAVAPSDHLIKREDEFSNVMNEAYRFASENDALLTLGIRPDRPETGYGYIQANTEQKGNYCHYPYRPDTQSHELLHRLVVIDLHFFGPGKHFPQ